MLSRIYIDNYKCLVNFELKLDGLSILHGDNGSGKSTVFEALRAIRKLLRDQCKVGEAFPRSSTTRFEQRTEQHFELDLKEGDDLFSYKLTVSHTQADSSTNGRSYIAYEGLSYNDIQLINFKDGEGQIYARLMPPGKLISNPMVSALAMFEPNFRDERIRSFMDQIIKVIVLKLEPSRMSVDFNPDARILADDGENFPAWWSNIVSGEYSHLLASLYERLGDVIAGFRSITTQDYQASRQFAALIENQQNGGKACKYSLRELSDGERALLVLYSLLYGIEPGSHILCFDEPDNFVSLAELYPWLTALNELCEEHGQQALIISHHPEFYDFRGGRRGVWLKREANGPTRVIEPQYPAEDDKQGLKLSELVARRWIE